MPLWNYFVIVDYGFLTNAKSNDIDFCVLWFLLQLYMQKCQTANKNSKEFMQLSELVGEGIE